MIPLLATCHYCSAELPITQRNGFCCAACETLFQANLKALNSSDSSLRPEKISAFVYLDTPEFKSKFSSSADEMTFYVEGLHCSSCVHLLERLNDVCSDVVETRVNFGASTLWVRKTSSGLWALIATTLRDLGYIPTPLNPNEDPRNAQIDDNRKSLRRIAVAGACAGNMMLFVIPVYAGLGGMLAQIFNGISFLLFIPVLTYSARPFFQGAWNSLKYKIVSVDLPIVVAFTAGFLLSCYNLFRGAGPVYFDSTAGFLFLILSSRYLLKRVQQNYQTSLAPQQIYSPEVVVGQRMTLSQGQKLYVDGRLLSPSAELDMSLFSGESLPQIFNQGMEIYAGTVLLSKNAEIEVTRINAETRLGQLMSLLKSEAVKKTSFVAITDRLAQALILVVFSVAVAYFWMNSHNDLDEALQRSLALIVVACPCALAFGAPLAYGLAIKKAREMGIVIKTAEVLEKILKIKNIFLDKTGTLTEGTLHLDQAVPREPTEEEKKIILALESESIHPIAFALRRSWPDFQNLPAIENRRETLGQGIEGRRAGDHYQLMSTSETSENGLGIDFKKNGELVTRFYFIDQLRADSIETLSKLKTANLFLLSGDSKAQARRVGEQCGLRPENTFGELSPERKWQIVKAAANTCMIGDGANDALALKSADVGIAVKGSIDLSLSSADVYFLRGGLSPLLQLIEIATSCRTTLRRNLVISLTYNTIGAILALGGFISPMVAAILMPLSSALLVLSSVWGLR